MFVQLKTVDLSSPVAEKSAELFVPESLDGLEELMRSNSTRFPSFGAAGRISTEGAAASSLYSDIVNNQYKKLWTYDAYLSVHDTELALPEEIATEGAAASSL